MLYSQGDSTEGSKDLEVRMQSNDLHSPRSSTYVGHLLQSAYWSTELNDIVVSTAHRWEGALNQFDLNRRGIRGHMTIWRCLCCHFALCCDAGIA